MTTKVDQALMVPEVVEKTSSLQHDLVLPIQQLQVTPHSSKTDPQTVQINPPIVAHIQDQQRQHPTPQLVSVVAVYQTTFPGVLRQVDLMVEEAEYIRN
jgi:hypothetical protein